MCGAIISIAVKHPAFGYVGIATCVIYFSILLIMSHKGLLTFDNVLRGSFASALMFWIPIFIISIEPEIQYNGVLFAILVLFMMLGALGVILFSSLLRRR
jgi:hypothetical protein